jgi:hypothetical protein
VNELVPITPVVLPSHGDLLLERARRQASAPVIVRPMFDAEAFHTSCEKVAAAWCELLRPAVERLHAAFAEMVSLWTPDRFIELRIYLAELESHPDCRRWLYWRSRQTKLFRAEYETRALLPTSRFLSQEDHRYAMWKIARDNVAALRPQVLGVLPIVR